MLYQISLLSDIHVNKFHRPLSLIKMEIFPSLRRKFFWTMLVAPKRRSPGMVSQERPAFYPPAKRKILGQEVRINNWLGYASVFSPSSLLSASSSSNSTISRIIEAQATPWLGNLPATLINQEHTVCWEERTFPHIWKMKKFWRAFSDYSTKCTSKEFLKFVLGDLSESANECFL